MVNLSVYSDSLGVYVYAVGNTDRPQFCFSLAMVELRITQLAARAVIWLLGPIRFFLTLSRVHSLVETLAWTTLVDLVLLK